MWRTLIWLAMENMDMEKIKYKGNYLKLVIIIVIIIIGRNRYSLIWLAMENMENMKFNELV